MANEERELRRMNRVELIEIIYHLQQDLLQLENENEELKKQLEDRRIRIASVGSIAEAALSLNGVFEAAQRAADQYLESVIGRAPEDCLTAENSEEQPEAEPEDDFGWEIMEAMETETAAAPETGAEA